MIRSLSEYLKISAPEIRNRKALLGFTERHAAELAKHQQMACWRVDRIVDRFYEKQTGDPGIAAIICSALRRKNWSPSIFIRLASVRNFPVLMQSSTSCASASD